MARFHASLALAALAATLCVTACGDSADSGDEETSSTAGPTMPATTSSTVTSMTVSTAGPTSSTGMDTGSSSAAESSSGGNGQLVTLQNDAWTPTETIVWQAWPNMSDCWGSSYEVDAGLLPLELVEVEVAIGGATSTETYEVSVWQMSGGLPSQEIDSAMVDIMGEAASVPIISLEDELSLPPMDTDAFAVVMCHVDHMGAPSIAIDADGNVASARNFVFQAAMGEWVNSPDFFGIDGDFIMRTIARTGM